MTQHSNEKARALQVRLSVYKQLTKELRAALEAAENTERLVRAEANKALTKPNPGAIVRHCHSERVGMIRYNASGGRWFIDYGGDEGLAEVDVACWHEFDVVQQSPCLEPCHDEDP